MPLQVDEGGGEALRRLIEELGVEVRTSHRDREGARRRRRRGSTGWTSPTARRLPVDVVVFATGVRPRDELAREAGLDVGERGGVVVDEACRDPATATSTRSARWPASTAAPGAWSAPATRWPRSSPTGCSAARRPSPAPTPPPSSSCSASTSPASATPSPSRPAPSRSSTPTRSPASTRSWCMSDDAQTLLGGMLVGDASRLRLAAADGRRSARAPTRPPGCCPRASTPPPSTRPARRRERLLLQQRHRRHHPRAPSPSDGLHRPRPA